MLIFRVFHEREILYQIVYGLGVLSPAWCAESGKT